MNNNDKRKFSQIMAGLSELYGKELTPHFSEVYFRSLSKYPIEAIDQAVSAHISSPDNGQYFPKPADIIRMIEGTSRDAAFVAWSKVDKSVRMVGPWQSVVFDDPIIHIVISDMGGWIGFGDKEEKEWPFVAKEFQERYNAIKSKMTVPDYPQKLIGEHEAANRKGGFDSPQPVLIGDQKIAEQIFLSGGKGNSLKIGTLDVQKLIKGVG